MLFEDLELSTKSSAKTAMLSDELRKRFEHFEEELRSGGRGGFGLRGFRIERGPGGRWHFDWFDNDDADSDEMHDEDTDSDEMHDERRPTNARRRRGRQRR